MPPLILSFKQKLLSFINTYSIGSNTSPKFAKRIKGHDKTFWKSSGAEEIGNINMSELESSMVLNDIKYWQSRLINKFNSRVFTHRHGCKVAKLYWKGRNFDDLDFDKLPANYVIRPTIGHSSDLVFLMTHSVNLMDKFTYSPERIKTILTENTKNNPSLEFLFEEFVKTEKGEYKIADDYKFYTYNGEIVRIEVINRLNRTDGFISYYDKDWNMIRNMPKTKYAKGIYQHPPACLQEMIENVKILGKSYEILVRIDFFATDKGAVFSKLATFTGIGNADSPKTENVYRI